MGIFNNWFSSDKSGDNSISDQSTNSSILASSIANSQLLLMTAAERGIEVTEDVIRAIVDSQDAYHNNSIGPEQIVSFWHAYEALTNSLYPITIGSIKATFDSRQLNKGIFRFLLGKMSIPFSRKCAFTYKLVSSITLIMLIVLQIFWSIGNTLVTDIKKQTDHLSKLEELIRTTEISGLRKRLSGASSDSNNSRLRTASATPSGIRTTTKSRKVTDLDNQLRQYLSWRDAEMEQLKNWNTAWSNIIFFIKQSWEKQYYSTLSSQSQDHVHFVAAQYVLDAIYRYLLPTLYGLLGATFYVLRQLPKDIEGLTFSMNSQIDYSLRITQGPLAGIMASFLFTDGPAKIHTLISSDQTAATIKLGSSTLSNFSPLALAFLAGYSVELIFKVIDKVISAATSKPTIAIRPGSTSHKATTAPTTPEPPNVQNPSTIP
ncbi:MAG: hypothetical protein COB93_09915 [Sneathiella sp.]|nr:MAG: hypothetical protein COB93_09915 [Sneathiella sp.]